MFAGALTASSPFLLMTESSIGSSANVPTRFCGDHDRFGGVTGAMVFDGAQVANGTHDEHG